MTPRSEASPDAPAPAEDGGLVGRAQARLRRFEKRARAWRLVAAVQRVLDTYNHAGGGLTASGLANGALFAVVPGLLLLVSVLVIVVDNQTNRDQVIDWVTEQLPPLAAFADEIVKGLAQSARVGSVVGLIGFIWGASGFYLGLEGAMERLFPGPKRRDPIMGRVRGVIGVVAVVGAVLTMFVLSTLVSFLPTAILDQLGAYSALISPLVAVLVATAVSLVVFTVVPSDSPTWRAALPPAFVAGVGIGLLTSLYAILAPLLVGGFTGLGTIAFVFAALVWFNWVFQILMYAGAWARLRRDRSYVRGIVR
jgi:uncharacterized BrkB/YihY/UPF0761 family membrane protein